MKSRHQRLFGIGLGLLLLCGALFFVLNAFQSNLVFFFTPTQVAAGEAPKEGHFRVGGLVKEGSIQRSNCSSPSGEVTLTRNRPLTSSKAVDVDCPRLSTTCPSVQWRNTPTLCSDLAERAVSAEFSAHTLVKTSASSALYAGSRGPLGELMEGRLGGKGMVSPSWGNVF